MADNGRMATENAAAISLDLARLRRSCGECSLQGLCLPAGVDGDDLGRLDAVVQRRKPLRPGETLFRTGDAVALTEARVCELPFASLAAIAAQLPSLQQQLLRVIGQSTDRDHDHVDVLSRRQASERIALFLHGLGERYRRIGRPADDFRLPMSRDEIARYLGLALETVSRGFSRLHEDGVIEVAGRRVRILDEHALHEAANGCEADGGRPQRKSGRA